MEPHAFTGVVPVFIRQQIVRGDIRRSDFVCAFIRGFTAVVFCAKADKIIKPTSFFPWPEVGFISKLQITNYKLLILPLGPLKPSARAFLAVFLAFFGARVACQKTAFS